VIVGVVIFVLLFLLGIVGGLLLLDLLSIDVGSVMLVLFVDYWFGIDWFG